MKTYTQTILGKGGNCFATCIACLLEVDPETVPNFCAEPKDDWYHGVQEWLKKTHGLVLVFVSENESKSEVLGNMPSGVYCIVTGEGGRGLLHCVIGKTRREGEKVFIDVVHDPHPSRRGLKTFECFEFLAKIF